MRLQSITQQTVLWALLVVISASAGQTAVAINKYRGLLLSDDILGGRARSLTKVGPGTLGIVGAQNTIEGRSDAVYWAVVVGPAGEEIFIDKYVLPKPSGWNAEATGIAFLEGDPDRPIIVGFQNPIIFDSDGAVIWRRDSTGQFTGTILDDEAVRSRANGVSILNTPLGPIIVVCGRYQLPNGNWHACLWKISAGGIDRVDLGTLGGPNSEAVALSYVDDLIGWNVVGNGERPNGRMVATAWIVRLTGSGGLDWFIRALLTPLGAESNAVSVGSANGGIWKTTGFVSDANGQRSASVWINQGEIPSAFVSVLYQDVLGRRLDTIANGLSGDSNSDRDVDAADFVVGTAHNSQGQRRGIGALPFNQPFNGPFRFDLLRSRDLVLDWNSISLNAIAPGGAIAGQGLAQGSPTPRAMLFLPTSEEVPQIIAILIGMAVGQSDLNEIYQAWQHDGHIVRLAPRRVGSVYSIMAEWTSTRASNFTRAPEKLTIVSRILPRNANPTSDLILNLQIYDPGTAEWIDIATRTISNNTWGGGGGFFTIEIDIPQQIVIPSGQPLRWRTQLRGEEWRDWLVDLMEMKTMPIVP